MVEIHVSIDYLPLVHLFGVLTDVLFGVYGLGYEQRGKGALGRDIPHV